MLKVKEMIFIILYKIQGSHSIPYRGGLSEGFPQGLNLGFDELIKCVKTDTRSYLLGVAPETMF